MNSTQNAQPAIPRKGQRIAEFNLEQQCLALRADNARLRGALNDAAAAMALQQMRDRADPKCVEGWGLLIGKARDALKGAK